MSNLVERLERLVQFLLDHIFFLLNVVELDFITLDSLDKLMVFFDEDVIGALQFHVCLAQMSDAILELQKALFNAKCVDLTFCLFNFCKLIRREMNTYSWRDDLHVFLERKIAHQRPQMTSVHSIISYSLSEFFMIYSI